MPRWEIEITDARGAWGTKGFPQSPPGVYVTEDPFVAERAALASHVFVRELKPREKVEEETTEPTVRTGTLTVQDLRRRPPAIKTCPDCERTYKQSHKRCPAKKRRAKKE